MPLISAIAAIPSSALQTTLSLTGTNRVNDANTMTSFSSSNTGFGSTGLATTSFGQGGNTIGNGGVAVIRRGSELLADQLTSALGGAATLIDMLQSYEQSGQVYLGNIRTSVQGLTSRLMNTAYNGANVLIQQLSNQAVSSPTGDDFFYRRGGNMAITTTRPTTNLPFVLSGPPSTVAQDGFGFGSGINGQAIADLGSTRDGVDELNNFSRDTNSDGLSSVVVSAATPFGTLLGNLFADGTTNNLRNVGQSGSSSDSSLVTVQPALDTTSTVDPATTITNALNAFGLLS